MSEAGRSSTKCEHEEERAECELCVETAAMAVEEMYKKPGMRRFEKLKLETARAMKALERE